MRSFVDVQLNTFGFTENELQHYKDLSLNGPFTDFVVASSDDTVSTFIKLGYELITDRILGCRTCAQDKLIRHVQIVSEEADVSQFKKEIKHKIKKDMKKGMINNMYNSPTDRHKELSKEELEARMKQSKSEHLNFVQNLVKGHTSTNKKICSEFYKDK